MKKLIILFAVVLAVSSCTKDVTVPDAGWSNGYYPYYDPSQDPYYDPNQNPYYDPSQDPYYDPGSYSGDYSGNHSKPNAGSHSGVSLPAPDAAGGK